MSSSAASAIAGPSQSRVETNSRGIPHAPFISNVQEYLGGPDEEVEPTLKKFQETMSKYKFMELNTAQRRRGLEEKIPDIRKTLQMVNFLKAKKDDAEDEPIETTFELNDTLFAKGKLDPVDTVHLWLGANVMLEYPLEEAISLLTSKLAGAEKSLAASKEDLDFLREQITIMEVNTARVHNWDVKRRRERREQLEKEGITEDSKQALSGWLKDDRDEAREWTTEGRREGSDATERAYPDKEIDLAGTEAGPNGTAASASTTPATAEQAPSQSSQQAEEFHGTAKGAKAPAEDANNVDSGESNTTALQPPTSQTPIEKSTNGPKKPTEASSTPLPTPSNVVTHPPNINTPTHDLHSSTALIVPPLNFSMVSRGIYRSGHPNERNFEFLRRLSLRSVLYLGTEDYRSNMTNWANSQGIQIFHLRLAINKEPTAEMDEGDVVKALQLILKPENWPILIHCNKGKYRVGCIVGLIRRLQGWSHTSIFEEYSRFAGMKVGDLEFIEVFDLSQVSLTA